MVFLDFFNGDWSGIIMRVSHKAALRYIAAKNWIMEGNEVIISDGEQKKRIPLRKFCEQNAVAIESFDRWYKKMKKQAKKASLQPTTS